MNNRGGSYLAQVALILKPGPHRRRSRSVLLALTLAQRLLHGEWSAPYEYYTPPRVKSFSVCVTSAASCSTAVRPALGSRGKRARRYGASPLNGCLCLCEGGGWMVGWGWRVEEEWFLDAACHHRTAAMGGGGETRAPEREHTHTHRQQLLRSHFSMFMNISHAFNSEAVCDY